MKFQRIYLEISNVCNLQCSFCPEVQREKVLMSPEKFETALIKVLPYTQKVCLHLMGEPMGHPQFETILNLCDKHQAQVILTTNGTLLKNYLFESILKHPSLFQINFSIHSFLDNYPNQNFSPYLMDILQFSKEAMQARPELYINYRLWNLESINDQNHHNLEMLNSIMSFYSLPIEPTVHLLRNHHKSKNIIGRIYLHFDTRFDWPSESSEFLSQKGFCYALSQHIGIHANGSVVACCLDKEARLTIGNIFEQDLPEIMNHPKAQMMLKGFQNHQLKEKMCQRCQYIQRFN